MESAIKEQLDAAKSGDMGPLLDVLKNGGVQPGQKMSDWKDPDAEAEPVDQRWFDVLAAYNDDELTDDQMSQCQDAVGLTDDSDS